MPATLTHPAPAALRDALRCTDPGCLCRLPGRPVHCPAHRGRLPALTVDAGPDSRLTFSCTQGCSPSEIAYHLHARGILPPPSRPARSDDHGIVLAGVAPRTPGWLWHGYIPLGRLTLLVGADEQARSWTALDIAARASTGAPAPSVIPAEASPCRRAGIQNPPSSSSTPATTPAVIPAEAGIQDPPSSTPATAHGTPAATPSGALPAGEGGSRGASHHPSPFTDHRSLFPKGRVLLLTPPEGLEDTIIPRLIAQGADLSQVHSFPPDISHKDGSVRRLRLPQDAIPLDLKVGSEHARLLVVDSLERYTSGTPLMMRQAMECLAAIAARTGAAVLATAHVPHDDLPKALAYLRRRPTPAAASVLVLADLNNPPLPLGAAADDSPSPLHPTPDGSPSPLHPTPDPAAAEAFILSSRPESLPRQRKGRSGGTSPAPHRILAPLKPVLSLGPLPPAFAIAIHSPAGPPRRSHPVLTWASLDDIRSKHARRNERAQRLDAIASFLEMLLFNGPKPADDVHRLAAEQGISRSLLYEVAGTLGVRFVRANETGGRRGKGAWHWLLPGRDFDYSQRLAEARAWARRQSASTSSPSQETSPPDATLHAAGTPSAISAEAGIHAAGTPSVIPAEAGIHTAPSKNEKTPEVEQAGHGAVEPLPAPSGVHEERPVEDYPYDHQDAVSEGFVDWYLRALAAHPQPPPEAPEHR